MQLVPLIGVALSTLSGVLSLGDAEWRKQSIYQVLTDRFARTDLSTTAPCDAAEGIYCGGTWQGIIKKLDYIQNMGFTAIWISPVVKQMSGNTTDGSSYHGYWAQDIYSLNSAFGSAADLQALSAALHARDMYLMVDVVTNHMGYDGCRACVNYSVFNPFNSISYYHPPCAIDYTNQTSVEVCWEGDDIVSLPDLRTEDSDVRSTWNAWITQLVANYSIDGLRIDSAKDQEQSFYAGFLAAAGVYAVGEVADGDPAYVAPYQNYIDGVLDYPSYYWITQAFQSTTGSISNLVNGINTLKADTKDTGLYGSFLENHDQPRFPSLTSDMALAKNAIAFVMLKDGIPIIYEGQEQHYSGTGTPNNREAVWLSGYLTSSVLYTWITTLNQLRNYAIKQDANYTTSDASPIYSDSQTIALRKGDDGYQIVSIFTNVGAGGVSAAVVLPSSQTGLGANEALVDVLSCESYTTDGSGNLNVAPSQGLPRALYPVARLSGSGICTTTTAPPPPSCSAPLITFNELVNTTWGDTIEIVGSLPALGNWDPSQAVALNANQYTTSNPLWSVTLDLGLGAFEYKFIKVNSTGSVTWEADPNHTYTAVCGAQTVSDTWQ